MKFYFLTTLGILVSGIVWANSNHGAHGADEGIPRIFYYQALNVALIFGAGIYFGRDKVRKFFENKQSQFLAAQEKAQSYLKQAEHEHHEVKTRLDKLKITREESISKAKAGAIDLRNQIVQDAHSLSKKLKEEAEISARLEIERAKFHLKEQLIRESFELSKKDLTSKATSEDQRKLQEDFISKVQVVQ